MMLRKLAVVILSVASSGTLFAQTGDDILDRSLKRDPWSDVQEIWGLVIQRDGSLDRALKTLEKAMGEEGEAASRTSSRRLAAALLRRRGDLRQALETLDGTPEAERTTADRMVRAELLDALGDANAVEAYGAILELDLDDETRNRILLRRALLTETEDGTSALAAFARKTDSVELRNQAAVILALENSQRDAIEIFQVSGEGTKRFRQEVRLCEWALDCAEWRAAQGHGWAAVGAAKMKRDRRYALTLMVEAYRGEGALDRLVEEFRTRENLSNEARQVWIDVLRETGRVDEALDLFRAGGRDGFNSTMRRELLEICRQSGREEVLVDAYRELIAAEPDNLEWREGLSRHFLERGQRSQALGLWSAVTGEAGAPSRAMAAAHSLMELGLDDVCERAVRQAMTVPSNRAIALLFLFELHLSRGRHEKARAALEELDATARAVAPARKDLADGFARLGDKERAVSILEGISKAKGELASPDLEMKLALMLSDVDRDEDALARWRFLWRKTNSIPRRRYVEDRLMTVAARLGELARIAVDIEKKLVAGKADDREAGLLVRLYTKVNDPVSATEVIEEHMTKQGVDPVEVLAEKARVFLSCTDYYNYEETIEKLIAIDEEGRVDHLRELAMSKLERGKQDEAREILARLEENGGDFTSAEFEAGVFAISGMREEALTAYRRGMANNPGLIDTYLLLSNVQNDMGRYERSAGMFQHLAATAEKDDLFTIAIDGILNMRDGRANRGAPDRLVRWARRVTLERIARKPNKLYLYQLAADLADELNDTPAAIRALESALPVAGEQRTMLLRELMTRAKPNQGRGGAMMVIGGPRPVAKKFVDNAEQLAFGRRLLGQGELVPPQVYLELGQAFLDAGEVSNALKTFGAASRLPEFDEMQREIAVSFERARYPREALQIYERILAVESSDVGLLLKVGELQEQTGRDGLARSLYQSGLELAMQRVPQKTDQALTLEMPAQDDVFSFSVGTRSVSEDEEHFDWLVKGLLATIDEDAALTFIAEERARIEADIEQLSATESRKEGLGHHPRLKRRCDVHRRMAVAFKRMDMADDLDQRLLGLFPKDEALLEFLFRERLSWGYTVAARGLVRDSSRPDAEKNRLLMLSGAAQGELKGNLTIPEVAGLLLPLVVDGQDDVAKSLLERLDLSGGTKVDLERMPVVLSAAAFVRNSELSLALCRHWMSLLVEHGGNDVYEPIQNLLRQSRAVLDPSQRKSLMYDLVARVLEDPDALSVLLSRLPDLQKEFGERLMTTEQVRELIDKRLDASDRFIWGIPGLFALIQSEDRAEVFRGVWPKVAKAQRCNFIAQMLPVLDGELDSTFADSLVKSFETALSDIEDVNRLSYAFRNLRKASPAILDVAIRVLDDLLIYAPESIPYRANRAVLLKEVGRLEEAKAEALEAYNANLAAPSEDYSVKSAIRRVLSAFTADAQVFLGAIAAHEETNGHSVAASRKRLEVLKNMGVEPSEYRRQLAIEVERHPRDSKLVAELSSAFRVAGRRLDAIEVDGAVAETDSAAKSRVVSGWIALKNWPAALVAKSDGQEDKGADDVVNRRKERTPAASVRTIKKALDDGRPDDARVLTRRLWRVFPDRSESYYQFDYRRQVREKHTWPSDESKKDAKAVVFVGGYPPHLDEPVEDRRKKRTKVETLSMHRALESQPFGPGESIRRLRCFEAGELDSAAARELFELGAERMLAEEGWASALSRVLEQEKRGGAGTPDYGMLFRLLEEADSADAVGDATLSGILENVDPTDMSQIRRMARLYIRLGKEGRAATLYRWAATREGTGGFFEQSESSLLDEVVDQLEGEPRDQAVADILAFTKPPENYPWWQDEYWRSVLATWDRILGPTGALEKARDVCEAVSEDEESPRRETAKMAAYLFAHAGEIEPALSRLATALCRKETPDDDFGGRDYGSLSDYDLKRLFPSDMSSWAKPEEWLLAASRALVEWDKAGKLGRQSRVFESLAVLSVRLHECDAKEQARSLFDELCLRVGDDAALALWVADVARRIGLEDEADARELSLLKAKRLHVERVPEVVRRILREDGAAEALTVGEAALEWTTHPKLFEVLTEAAESAGDRERVARLQKRLAESEAARKKLEK